MAKVQHKTHCRNEYTMTLSQEEAQFLSDILLHVSGAEGNTRRVHAARIRCALVDDGVFSAYDAADIRCESIIHMMPTDA